jgi:hypothetical protein
MSRSSRPCLRSPASRAEPPPSEGRVSEFITSPPIAYGREVRIEGQARCSVPRVQLRVPAGELLKGGIYLVAAQAGAITSYRKVAVALKTNNFL